MVSRLFVKVVCLPCQWRELYSGAEVPEVL